MSDRPQALSETGMECLREKENNNKSCLCSGRAVGSGSESPRVSWAAWRSGVEGQPLRTHQEKGPMGGCQLLTRTSPGAPESCSRRAWAGVGRRGRSRRL